MPSSSVPTSAPTFATCDFDILLFDLFGDGWANAELLVNINGVTSNYTLSCGHCDYLNFTATPCNVTISMDFFDTDAEKEDGDKDDANKEDADKEDEVAITPWENYFVISFMGENYVGDYETSVVIDHQNITGKWADLDGECDQCDHPKKKPSPKSRPGDRPGNKRRLGKQKNKPPPAVALPVRLNDENGNGELLPCAQNPYSNCLCVC
jgi:hypothetical protein